MKRMTLIAIILFFAGIFVQAHDQELFLQGNAWYEKGDYQKALESYSTLSPKSSTVWHNIGLCYYKLQKYDHAHACFIAALAGASWSRRSVIDGYIAELREKITNGSDVSGIAKVHYYLAYVASLLPLLAWQMIVIFVWFLFVVCWSRAPQWHSVHILLLLVAFISALLVYIHYQDYNQYLVVPRDDECGIFAGPDPNYHVVTTMQHPRVLKMLDIQGKWCKVQFSQAVGWMPQEKLVM